MTTRTGGRPVQPRRHRLTRHTTKALSNLPHDLPGNLPDALPGNLPGDLPGDLVVK
ncbi:MAG: hypothetical protein AAGJ95_05370 [Cyanobacteria bacterium J06554_11]